MARYVILRHEDAAPPGGRPAVLTIRDGFSLLAFLFSLFWLLWHRLWIAALAVLAASVVLALLTRDPQWALLGLPLNLLLGAFVGLEGQGWRIGAARLRGYRLADIVDADTRDEAELRFVALTAGTDREAPLRADMVPGRRLAADTPDFLFAAPGGASR